VSARFWIAAEILPGLDDEFAADKLFSLRLALAVLLALYIKPQTSDIKHRRLCGLYSSFILSLRFSSTDADRKTKGTKKSRQGIIAPRLLKSNFLISY
jgi:hypothetical protein